MIKIKIISVGKLKEKSLKELTAEYEKRLKRYVNTEFIEINDLPVCDNPSASQINEVLNKEAEEIIKKINPKAYLISMCIEGKKTNSVNFSKIIFDTSMNFSEIDFVIGSSHGLSSKIKDMSNFKLSMSDMTFPHNLARLMLLEQIYRACKINSNEAYHK